jgi:hypothetical protein
MGRLLAAGPEEDYVRGAAESGAVEEGLAAEFDPDDSLLEEPSCDSLCCSLIRSFRISSNSLEHGSKSSSLKPSGEGVSISLSLRIRDSLAFSAGVGVVGWLIGLILRPLGDAVHGVCRAEA